MCVLAWAIQKLDCASLYQSPIHETQVLEKGSPSGVFLLQKPACRFNVDGQCSSSFEYDDVMHHTTRKCVSSVSDAIVFPSLNLGPVTRIRKILKMEFFFRFQKKAKTLNRFRQSTSKR